MKNALWEFYGFNLTRAFNSVKHTIPINKLNSLGITKTTLLCFESYITGRSQFMKRFLTYK